MDYVQIVNLNELLAFNEHLMGRIDEQHRGKALRWLNSNVKNAVIEDARERVDSWFNCEGEGRSEDHSTLLTVNLLLTPKDFRESNLTVRRLDLYAISQELREAYIMGSALLVVDNWQEYGDQVVHLCEALSATKGQMKNWDSITVAQAKVFAKAWVDALNKHKVKGGGTVTEIGTYEGFTLVKLEDQAAYISEGQIMDHCVADCWGKLSSIYSLRREGKRYATIEIRGDILVQVKGKTNVRPESHPEVGTEVGRALRAVFAAHKWYPDNTFGGLRMSRHNPIEDALDFTPDSRASFLGFARQPTLYPVVFPEIVFLDKDGVEINRAQNVTVNAKANGRILDIRSREGLTIGHFTTHIRVGTHVFDVQLFNLVMGISGIKVRLTPRQAQLVFDDLQVPAAMEISPCYELETPISMLDALGDELDRVTATITLVREGRNYVIYVPKQVSTDVIHSLSINILGHQCGRFARQTDSKHVQFSPTRELQEAILLSACSS